MINDKLSIQIVKLDNRLMKVSEKIKEIKEKLSSDYEKTEIDAFIRIIFEHLLAWDWSRLLLNHQKTISKKQEKDIDNIIDSLLLHKPIQYITGKTYFYDLEFLVSPAVLIPRQETEELVHLIVQKYKNKNPVILDIGVGSGCIAVSLAENISKAEVWALDISEEALKIARLNAKKNNVEINFILCDISKNNAWLKFEEKFDIIISNPPYVTAEDKTEMLANVTEYEPPTALYTPENNPIFFYEKISDFALKKLKKDGKIYFELNEKTGQEVKLMMKNKGFNNISIIKDMNNKNRFIEANYFVV